LRLFFIAALLVVAAETAPAGPTRAEEPVPGSGERGPVLEPASVSAASDPAWNALSNQGLSSDVFALAAMGDDLYVGGRFTATSDWMVTGLNRIARYDVVAETWHALPAQGLNGTVFALALDGSDLYVGGTFFATVGGVVTNLGNIARYDTGTTTWHALPNQGLSGPVYALAVMGDDLYVGGYFTQTVDGTVSNLNHIARYDTGTTTWHGLPNEGLDDYVRALVTMGDDLYVGGNFAQTGDGTVSDLGRIVRHDITDDTWNALPNHGLNNTVYALAAVGDDLYVGGAFTQSGDVVVSDLGRIVRYDTTGGAWHALPNQGLGGVVQALMMVGSDLYVGGAFGWTGDGTLTNLGYIARYDTAGGAWHALPNQGLDYIVYALAVAGDDLYMGGAFGATGDWTVLNLNGIARYVPYPYRVYLPLVIRQ
jgi:N-acetylneuraminic acid mutarotase